MSLRRKVLLAILSPLLVCAHFLLFNPYLGKGRDKRKRKQKKKEKREELKQEL